ncbi:MAG: hypothetical protein ACP5OP_02655 [Leptospirillia bacterium]
MTLVKQMGTGLMGAGILLCFSACAGAPIKHPNRLQAAAHLGSAQELLLKNHPRQAILSVKKALALHRISGDYNGTISDMNRLARLSILIGRPDQARKWIDRALLFESVADAPDLKAETLLLGSEIASEKSQEAWIAEARKSIDSLAGNREDARQRLLSRLYQIQAERLSLQKKYPQAGNLYKKALTLDESRGNQLSIATDLAGLARNDLLSGHINQALDSFSRAEKIDRALHNSSGLAFDLEGQALAHISKGEYDLAARDMLTASGIQLALGHRDLAQNDLASIKTFASKIGGVRPGEIRAILDQWLSSHGDQE